MAKMKIVLPGGTGQLGTLLARAFVREGHEVTVLGRRPAPNPGWKTVAWDPPSLGGWTSELEGADAVINLAGRSVNCRYSPENRRLIRESRVDSTRAVGEAIRLCKRTPRIWLQAGSATIYSHRYDAPNNEATGLMDGPETRVPDTWRFSTDVAASWERAMEEATLPRTRKVVLRISIVLNPDRGSAFEELLRLVRFGLGGRAGNGRQFVSWIHDADFVRAVSWILARDSIHGPVNLSAPNPVTNDEFMRTLREEWGFRFGLPAPEWLLEIGARVVGTETELILKSRRVIPGVLAQSGFEFEYPSWREAARNLCRRWRADRRTSTNL
jgi:uncharacterized protein (TIGR01777 family)